MTANYRKLLQEEAARERAKAEKHAAEREAEQATGNTGQETGNEEPAAAPASAAPTASGEVDVPTAPPAEPYRPQPFTADLIPEPKDVDAEGDLTPREIDELAHCEAAYANANRAEWMKWKAAHAVRSRRIYRQGGRTWPEYCEDKFGESESEVNRRIQQWPLLKAISEQQDQPRSIPDSHVQTLLPMQEIHGQDVTARAYVELRTWAGQHKQRVTADVVRQLVEIAKAAEPPALTANNTFQLAIEAKPKRGKATARKAAAPPAPRAEPHTGSHPNLGESGGESGDDGVRRPDDQEQPEPEHPADAGGHADDERAAQVRDLLATVREAVSAPGVLRGASTDTLKAIVSSAQLIADACNEELGGR